jgi:hypothetical protein
MYDYQVTDEPATYLTDFFQVGRFLISRGADVRDVLQHFENALSSCVDQCQGQGQPITAVSPRSFPHLIELT